MKSGLTANGIASVRKPDAVQTVMASADRALHDGVHDARDPRLPGGDGVRGAGVLAVGVAGDHPRDGRQGVGAHRVEEGRPVLDLAARGNESPVHGFRCFRRTTIDDVEVSHGDCRMDSLGLGEQ